MHVSPAEIIVAFAKDRGAIYRISPHEGLKGTREEVKGEDKIKRRLGRLPEGVKLVDASGDSPRNTVCIYAS